PSHPRGHRAPRAAHRARLRLRVLPGVGRPHRRRPARPRHLPAPSHRVLPRKRGRRRPRQEAIARQEEAGRRGSPVTDQPLLDVDELSSGYGALQVLFDVSLDVRPGEIVALMGSNGAGKTTLLKTITGQLHVLSGHVSLEGTDVTGCPAEVLVRQGVALVPEGRGMLRDLTVAQNLELGAYIVRDRAR